MFGRLMRLVTWVNETFPRVLDISPWIWIPLAMICLLVALLAMISKVPLSYVYGNLAVRWRTTLLTALAFTLVVSLLTVMLAFVNGMYALTKASGHPDNLIILSEGSTDEGFSNMGYGDVGDIENQPGIDRVDNRPLVSRETYIVVNQPIDDAAAGRPKRRFLQLRGIQDAKLAADVHRIKLFEGGEWFSDAGVREVPGDSKSPALIEVVLGEGIAREMGKDHVPVASLWGRLFGTAEEAKPLAAGDTFKLNDRTWLVTGVMRSSGSTFDSELWAKQSLIGPLFGKESISTLIAKAPSAEGARSLREYFTNDYKKSAVNAQVETDYFAKLSQTNIQFLVAILFVTIFLAVGGMFGIMNTMFAAISQRIKDIGVLRLLGYRRRHILSTFLLESIALAVVGGLIGCAVGWLCDGWSANSIVSSGPGGGKFVVLKLTVDNQTFAINMLLSLTMGLLGGLLPSLRAMKLTALETLR